jgi:hypothetical protein
MQPSSTTLEAQLPWKSNQAKFSSGNNFCLKLVCASLNTTSLLLWIIELDGNSKRQHDPPPHHPLSTLNSHSLILNLQSSILILSSTLILILSSILILLLSSILNLTLNHNPTSFMREKERPSKITLDCFFDFFCLLNTSS